MAKFEIPVLAEEPLQDIPRIQADAMAHSRPFFAKPEHNIPLGFPGELVDNWQEKALTHMKYLLKRFRSLRVFLDSCVKCGSCADKCHYFLGTGDPKNMPVARQDLFRSIYRRYFTLPGKLFGPLVGGRDLTRNVLDEWYSYFHQCSQCRRCSVFCPYGIDTAEISMAARDIMNHIGYGQKYCNEIITKVHKIGNNLGLPKPALADTLAGLEEDVLDETGYNVKFPLDVDGAEILLVTPSADFFAEPHVDGLIGYAKVFHQAGISWTISSYASEAANFGMFIGSYEQMHKVANRIRKAAYDLKVKRIVFGECGHAWRVAYSFLNTLVGPWDFLDLNYPVPQHVVEFTTDMLKRGGIKLDKSANNGMIVTFHDSCNVARGARMGSSPGGQFTLPRELIKACVPQYIDMHPDTSCDKTFCCGGGGGLLTDDLIELRVKGAKPRVEALRQVMDMNGVTHMATLCAICKSQFTKVLPYYNIEMDAVVSVHGLVNKAIQLGTNVF